MEQYIYFIPILEDFIEYYNIAESDKELIVAYYQ